MALRPILLLLLLPVLFAPPTARATPRLPYPMEQALSASQSKVSIPAGLYTLKELTARLSTPGAPVTVATPLAPRLAFVCLKNRPQSEALHLVEMAFAVTAQPQQAPLRGYRVTADPEVVKRERRWMNRFVALVEGQATEQIDDYLALSDLSTEQVLRERDKRNAEQAAQYKRAKAQAERDKTIQWGAGASAGEQAYLALYGRYSRAMVAEYSREQWRKPLGYLRRKKIVPTLVGETVRRGAFLSGEGVDSTAYYLTYASLRRSGESYNMDLRVDVLHPDRTDVWGINIHGGPLTPFLFGTESQKHGDPIPPLLGEDAVEWIAAERAQTAQFLASPDAIKPLPLGSDLPSDALSSRVWQWCVAFGREAVVEIFPTVDATEVEGGSLADVVRRGAYWSAREENGVAVFTNRLAFLDRLRRWEFGALQTLVQNQINPEKPVGAAAAPKSPIANRDVFPASLLSPLSERAWEDKTYSAFNWPGMATSRDYYYHYEPDIIDSAAAIGLLWTHLPTGKNAPGTGTAPLERTEIPLRSFGEPTLRLFTKWLDATGTVTTGHPDFLNYLRRFGRLVWEPAGGRSVKVFVTLDERKSPLFPKQLPKLTVALDPL